MRTVMLVVVGGLVVLLAAAAAGIAYVKLTGLRGQPEPSAVETGVVRRIRALAIPLDVRSHSNPLAQSEDAFWLGLEHFAVYCAVCHANDGSGEDTAFGSGLYPKPPDLRAEATQGLTDGELFYIIENGVRFTGMPAFGTGDPNAEGEAQTWQLVRFIRELPTMSMDAIWRMRELNPL